MLSHDSIQEVDHGRWQPVQGAACKKSHMRFGSAPVLWEWVGCGFLDLLHGKIGTSAAGLPVNNGSAVTAA